MNRTLLMALMALSLPTICLLLYLLLCLCLATLIPFLPHRPLSQLRLRPWFRRVSALEARVIMRVRRVMVRKVRAALAKAERARMTRNP
jgi:hypothetical protein